MFGLGKLFGAGIGEAVGGIADVVDKFVETDDEKRIAKQIRDRMLMQPQLAQVEINKIEAANRNFFVAGWRPFIGWVCGVCIGMFFIPQFAMTAYMWVTMCLEASQLLPYPTEGAEYLFELVLAMLGLSGLRTYEKLKGKTS